MSEENCQAADELVGIISTVTLDEIQDVEKALRFIERTVTDVRAGRVELSNLDAIPTLAAIHHTRLQRQRIEWEQSSAFQKIRHIMAVRRRRMSDFVRSECRRRSAR